MDNRPNGVIHTAPPLTRAAVILELIDRVLADCEPPLGRLQSGAEDMSR
jgi:hypothetical protein